MTEGYFNNLFLALLDKDQAHMSSEFATEFNKEVDTEGFIRGAKSFFVAGDTADDDCKYAFACLRRGDYPAVWMDARTVIRRLDSKYIPRWVSMDDAEIDAADTIIISGVFDTSLLQSITPMEQGDLVWFIKDAIHNGVVVVIPTTKDADLNLHGEEFGDFIEKHFEVINVARTEDNTKPKNKQSKYSRDAATIKRSGKHKRKNLKGD